jgi:hypothetical protein
MRSIMSGTVLIFPGPDERPARSKREEIEPLADLATMIELWGLQWERTDALRVTYPTAADYIAAKTEERREKAMRKRWPAFCRGQPSRSEMDAGKRVTLAWPSPTRDSLDHLVLILNGQTAISQRCC